LNNWLLLDKVIFTITIQKRIIVTTSFFNTGKVVRRADDEKYAVLFLPQKPLLTDGSLKQQVIHGILNILMGFRKCYREV
jgi:hypothetical protein